MSPCDINSKSEIPFLPRLELQIIYKNYVH